MPRWLGPHGADCAPWVVEVDHVRSGDSYIRSTRRLAGAASTAHGVIESVASPSSVRAWRINGVRVAGSMVCCALLMNCRAAVRSAHRRREDVAPLSQHRDRVAGVRICSHQSRRDLVQRIAAQRQDLVKFPFGDIDVLQRVDGAHEVREVRFL